MGKSSRHLADLENRRWTARDGTTWAADTRWAEVDGRAVCVSLTIRSCTFEGDRPDSTAVPIRGRTSVAPVRSDVLRSFPASMLDDLRRSIAEMVRAEGELMEEIVEPPQVQDTARPFDRPGRRGTKITGEDGSWLPVTEALEQVAAVYLAEVERAQAEGDRARPNVAVAQRFGISEKAASRRVARARGAGLIDPTRQGKAVG